MNKIIITETQLSNLYALIDEMEDTADEFVPSEDELKEICDNLAEYMTFLIWIDETGIETPENKTMRKLINKLIREQLIIKED